MGARGGEGMSCEERWGRGRGRVAEKEEGCPGSRCDRGEREKEMGLRRVTRGRAK
jgi:hypothetical protein